MCAFTHLSSLRDVVHESLKTKTKIKEYWHVLLIDESALGRQRNTKERQRKKKRAHKSTGLLLPSRIDGGGGMREAQFNGDVGPSQRRYCISFFLFRVCCRICLVVFFVLVLLEGWAEEAAARSRHCLSWLGLALRVL